MIKENNLICPKCGNSRLIWDKRLDKDKTSRITSNGYYQSYSVKKQRYRCGKCGKTFSETDGTIFYRSHLDFETLGNIAKGIAKGYSISRISKELNIRKATIYKWKHVFKLHQDSIMHQLGIYSARIRKGFKKRIEESK